MDYFDNRDNACMYEEGINNFTATDNVEVDSEIQKFYENKNVFVTSATGLIGSLLVERLLRLCPKLGKIYLLVTPNKKRPTEEKLEEFSSPEKFHMATKGNGDTVAKKIIIYGDCAKPWCGISEYDQNILIENVHVVYHCPTTIRINENLRNSYYINVRATQHLLELATKMKHIMAFLYVSTAFTHKYMKENFHRTFSENDMKFLEENLDDEQLEAISPRIVGFQENNYTFTKVVAEGIVKKYLNKIPVALVRPSIVVHCDKKPLVNWKKDHYGAIDVTTLGFTSAIREWSSGSETNANIIPADKVVSTMVAISWQMGTHTSNGNSSTTPVYNVVSSTKALISWGEYTNFIIDDFTLTYHPMFRHFLRDYEVYFKDHKWMYFLIMFIHHVLFTIIADVDRGINGKTHKLLNEFIKIHKYNAYLKYCCTHDWVFEQNNLDKLWLLMSDTDKKLFDFDMNNYNWKQFILRSCKNSMSCFLKKNLIDVDTSRKEYYRYQKIKNCLKIVMCGIVVFSLKGYLLSLLKFVNSVFL